MEGIQTPFGYYGSYLTYFGMHLENGNLNSFNYLHSGEPKHWYFVPSSENVKLEKLGNIFGKAVETTCKHFLRHKTLMIPPSILRQNGIKFGRVIQNPGEFIVSFAGGYHSGFNCGLNQTEAINFGSRRWLELFPQFKLWEYWE